MPNPHHGKDGKFATLESVRGFRVNPVAAALAGVVSAPGASSTPAPKPKATTPAPTKPRR